MYYKPKWEIYSKNVAKAVGVDVTKKTKDLNEKQKERFKEAIKRQEGYKAGTVIPAREEESYA